MNAKTKFFVRKELAMKRCRYCRSEENLTIDHKVPKSKGGTDDIKNLQCLCQSCNGRKSSLTHGEVINLIKWVRLIDKTREKNGNKQFWPLK